MTTKTEIHSAIKELTHKMKISKAEHSLELAAAIKTLCDSLEILGLIPDEDPMPIPVDSRSAKPNIEEFLKNPQEVSIDNPFGVGPNE